MYHVTRKKLGHPNSPTSETQPSVVKISTSPGFIANYRLIAVGKSDTGVQSSAKVSIDFDCITLFGIPKRFCIKFYDYTKSISNRYIKTLAMCHCQIVY